MDILYVLCLLTLNYFAADALLRGRSTTCPNINAFSGGKAIKYRRKGTMATFKCKRKFTQYGPNFATCLDDGTWSDETPLCIKTGCEPLDPSQVNNLDIMEIVKGALVKFTCLENYVLLGETQAYCDGKDWNASLPRCAAPHELLKCDFEEDFCGWTQDDSEEQGWVRNVGPTPTGNTGPKHDHTYGETGTGHYLFFEASIPAMRGHKASLLSPEYAASLSPICFDFWYHILGPDEAGHVGSLEVFVLDKSQFLNDTDIKPPFFIKGNQGNEWHRGEITIDKQDKPYQIAIVATRASSYNSDIAIDDVRLNNCSKQTSSEPSTPATKTITTTIPPKDKTAIKSMTTPTTKTSTTITKPIKKLTTIKQTTKSSTTVVSKAVTSMVSTFKTTKVFTTDTLSVSSRSSSITKKTKTSKHGMSASTARGSSSSSPMTQERNSIDTTQPTHTQAVTEPVTHSITSASTQTFTTTNKPGTTQKGLESTVTLTTNKKSTEASTSKAKKETVTPSIKSAKSSEIQTTIKDAPSKTTKVTQPTKRTNATTLSKRPNASNTTEDKSQHLEDVFSMPFIIWLCGGIVAGLIIIGVIVFVCILRRKFYTSTHEDNPKPITNSASIQSLNSRHNDQKPVIDQTIL